MCQHRAIRRAFTMIELMVVVAIIVVLVAILVRLGGAKESANVTMCQSGLRQWGMATQGYMTDYTGHLPREGASGQNTMADAWYNQLPPYVNQQPYDKLYTGTSVGASGGYANNWIWYCPTKISLGSKNSISGDNSFHYTFNAVLNGSSDFGPDYGSPPTSMHYNSASAIPQPAATVLFFEDDHNLPCDSPNSTDMARTRHFNNSLNLLFVDLHVQLLNGASVPVPTQNAAGLWTSLNPPLVWGPFPH